MKTNLLISLLVILGLGLSVAAFAAESSGAFLGIYPDNLSQEDIVGLEYPYRYGVVIRGVVNGSPAEHGGLMKDDIIMQMDGRQVDNNDAFSAFMDGYEPGEDVSFRVWRARNELVLDVELGSRETPTASRKKSVGFGGGTWIPAVMMIELDDANALLNQVGFDDVLPEDMVFMQGGAGKGHVGKGLFLGGLGLGYTMNKKIQNPTMPEYTTEMRYELSLAGVTLDKRFHIAGNLYGSLGLMLGAAGQSVEIINTNGNFYWDHVADSLFTSNNSNVKFSRDYLMVQPRAELLYRLLPWLGLRAEVAYNYGYAPEEGWKASIGDAAAYDAINSPDTPFQGLQISAGPWFGF